MNDTILHFTLGPVQGFVAQARRTRDLWGGSFLLSWLSAQAMKAVLDGGGRISFPMVHDANLEPTDPLLKAVMTCDAENQRPRIGTVPNRFKALVPSNFDPAACEQAVRQAWENVCRTVWDVYLQNASGLGQDTEAIWKRQTGNFWEINWVVGEDDSTDSDLAWLDRRKNWRSHQAPPEGGDHCMVMGDWQELSGYIRFRDRKKQDDFWATLRKQVQGLDLREDERLCAISLVKRLFPRLAREAIGWEMEVQNWPSTSYMAAVPWLAEAWKSSREKALDYVKAVNEACSHGIYGERKTRIKALEDVPSGLAGLDGLFFHTHALENEKLVPLRSGKDEQDRKSLISQLSALQRSASNASGRSCSPFYALLLMDGDNMGAFVRQYPEKLSQGLAAFTAGVENIVSQHSGVTIYAGGDDVLALMPLDTAIEAAHRLRDHYQQSFQMAEWATISAAIVYAHHNLPLRIVLHHAHSFLDGVAKDENGRDSLALAVLKAGAVNARWVAAWEPQKEVFPGRLLEQLADGMAREPQFSNRFLYALRERLGLLFSDNGEPFRKMEPEKLLLAEYLRNREGESNAEKGLQVVRNFLEAIHFYPGRQAEQKSGRIQVQGPLVLRFLAEKGVDQ